MWFHNYIHNNWVIQNNILKIKGKNHINNLYKFKEMYKAVYSKNTGAISRKWIAIYLIDVAF